MEQSIHAKSIPCIRSIALFCFFVVASLLAQTRISSRQEELPQIEQLKYLPSGIFLKGAALSYDTILADLLWVKALTYFGEQYNSDHNYSWLYHILDITTTLDPYFVDPYEFGGIVLANEVSDIENSSNLLLKGMRKVPQSNVRYWYLPFFLSYNYWYHKNDFKNGAKYLQIASRFPEAPSYLPLLTARMYADASQAEMALPFLNEMIKGARTPRRLEELQQRKKEVLVNRDLDHLDRAIKIYYKHFTKYPNSLDDLLQQKVIKLIPIEPFGGRYYYDPILHTAHSTLRERIKVNKIKF